MPTVGRPHDKGFGEEGKGVLVPNVQAAKQSAAYDCSFVVNNDKLVNEVTKVNHSSVSGPHTKIRALNEMDVKKKPCLAQKALSAGLVGPVTTSIDRSTSGSLASPKARKWKRWARDGARQSSRLDSRALLGKRTSTGLDNEVVKKNEDSFQY
ncbi:hypothetical protein QYF36_019772 [Acer negundo]|nr:hypothetical protein QYF36_019772 [Acer negundo]